MNIESLKSGISIYYAIENSLIEGTFNEIPNDAFYARIIQKLPYIDITGNYKIHEIAFTIFLGRFITETNEIHVFNFNKGKPYTLKFYKNNNDLICQSKDEFYNTIQNFKQKHKELQENKYTLKKEKN